MAALETSSKELDQEMGIATDGNQYLTFTLGDELYGVDILKVQEIKGYTAVTRIPNTPPYIKGVLNLRGTIVPIVDLRCRFNMEETKYTMFTVIVVVVVREKVVGLIVDSVSDVLNIAKQDIQDPPEFGHQIDTSFLNGIGKAGDKLVAVLHIERLFDETTLPGAA